MSTPRNELYNRPLIPQEKNNNNNMAPYRTDVQNLNLEQENGHFDAVSAIILTKKIRFNLIKGSRLGVAQIEKPW